jgi:hypothetical protein
MPSIEIKSAIKVEMDEILDGISNLKTPELETFLQEVAHLLAKRKHKTLSKRESELLLKINEPHLLNGEQEEYDLLYQKLENETISPTEHQRLLELIQLKEKKGVEKMQCLVELAQIRKVSLKALMNELGIHSIADA